MKVLLLLMFLVQSNLVLANAEVVEFSDESLRPRYQQLVEELRCPKCQNQNLADSNSPISKDLRVQVQQLLEEGLTDQQIKDYLKARYSEFILYRPEVNQATWLLWAAPVLFLIMGLLIIYRLYFRFKADSSSGTSSGSSDSSDSSTIEAASALNKDEQTRLDKLLADRK